jgi:hypothetical protein
VVLKFDNSWRFSPPEDGTLLRKAMPREAISEFMGLVAKIATQGDRQSVLEHFKIHFSSATGETHYKSSNAGWAESDLRSLMDNAASNAPLFIEAFYDACEALRNRHPEWYVPEIQQVNFILTRHEIGYEVRPPDLVFRENSGLLVPVPPKPPTLAETAAEVFQKSITRSEQLLMEGREREAVQELLWLLESVTTAFRGLETESGKIEGKYFNQIVRDLRNKHPGTTLERVLDWTSNLHGYLSSPTGGGIRHGLDLDKGVALGPREGRLFANLIRSYLSYFLAAHAALKERSDGA